MTLKIDELLEQANPVLPVLAVERVEDAVPLAKALKEGGLTVLEVTLRTEAAYEVIQAMKEVAGVVVGAGTVTNVQQLEKLEAMGADFAVSPGSTPQLLEAGRKGAMPFLPAVSSVSEILAGMEYGYDCFKFFPAEVSGGAAALKAFAGPLPNLTFCPTGGVNAANFRDYLKLPNVACVGGSWVVPKASLEQQDWAAITKLAREASGR